VRFHRLLQRDAELERRFRRLDGSATDGGRSRGDGTGWERVAARLADARAWARRRGRTPLVRELGALEREGTLRRAEILLEHTGALDTLASEARRELGLVPGSGDAAAGEPSTLDPAAPAERDAGAAAATLSSAEG